jgi:hypothetical protein
VALLRAALPCERAAAMRDDLVAYMVAAGVVHRLRDLFSLFDRHQVHCPYVSVIHLFPFVCVLLRQHQTLSLTSHVLQGGHGAALPPVVECSIRLLQTLALSPPSLMSASHKEQPPQGAYTLCNAMRETALAGLPSLLTTLLLSAERERRVPVLQCVEDAAAMLPSNFVAIATEALHCMNAFARARLTTAQQVGSGGGGLAARAPHTQRQHASCQQHPSTHEMNIRAQPFADAQKWTRRCARR